MGARFDGRKEGQASEHVGLVLMPVHFRVVVCGGGRNEVQAGIRFAIAAAACPRASELASDRNTVNVGVFPRGRIFFFF